MAGKDQVPKDFRRVVVAAAVGNIIEWYDFYIFGSLAAILSVKFFDKTHPVAALLSTIALFTAGFLIRPLGAFLFGWLGDRVGRKYTFILTLSGMGSTGPSLRAGVAPVVNGSRLRPRPRQRRSRWQLQDGLRVRRHVADGRVAEPPHHH